MMKMLSVVDTGDIAELYHTEIKDNHVAAGLRMCDFFGNHKLDRVKPTHAVDPCTPILHVRKGIIPGRKSFGPEI